MLYILMLMCTYTAFDSMMTVSNRVDMWANTNVHFIQNNHCEQRATHVASVAAWSDDHFV